MRHNSDIDRGIRQLLNNCEADTMNKSELFKAAHKLVKSVIKTGDDYRVTFGAAIKAIINGLVAKVEIFSVEFTNAWTGQTFSKEVEATSYKDAVQKFEAENKKKATYVSKKVLAQVEFVEDAENILFEMDMKGVDSMKFKGQRNTITVTRAKAQAYLDYTNSVKKIARWKALA